MLDKLPASLEVWTAAAAAAARDNQTATQATTSTEEEDFGTPTFIENMDYDSAFNTEVCDSQNTYTHICDVCNNVDITTGPSQLKDANITYTTKVKAIQNLHYCVGHISPERLQHLVEKGQWTWAHAFKPVIFARELPPCPYCV